MSAGDLVVVGGGPAGMSAAVAAAERGVSATVIDEGFDLGGQIYRRPTAPVRAPKPHPRGEELRARVAALGDRVEVRREAAAWGLFAGPRVGVVAGERSEMLHPKAVVLATGAYELVPPFPGWTLPGVMTPGAAQILAKTMGVSPGRRVVVAGTGPFLLVVAAQLVEIGVDVAAVLEATPRSAWLTLPLHGWRTPSLLADGLAYWRKLSRARVPLRFGRIVVEAKGAQSLHSIVHAPANDDWFPDRSTTETIDCDALLVGYGFVPRVQLAQMAGCGLAHRADVGGWVPVRDEDLETSVAGVFAAGDGAGVAGSLVAALEGRLAGLAAAKKLGALDAAAFASARRPLDRGLARIAPMRRALDRISRVRRGLASLVDDDTIVCRCEEATWRETKDAVRAGCTTYRALKVATRIGMGACQGRFCWPSVARLVAGETKQAVEAVGPSSARCPVRPITLGALAKGEA